MKDRLPYRKDLIPIAKKLRQQLTPGEARLWLRLKGKQVMGYDFDRQKPILDYIVDFYCKELRLAIEIDGSSHFHKDEEDAIRQERIEELGVVVVRFSEFEALKQTDEVISQLEQVVHSITG